MPESQGGVAAQVARWDDVREGWVCGGLVGRSFEKMEDDELSVFLTTACAIWGAMCRALMANECGDPGETLAYALKISRKVREHRLAPSAVNVAISPYPISWAKPADSLIKVNVDAGFVGSLGCGLGVVCKDASGAIVAAGTYQFHVAWETRIAEAKAIYYGLKVVLELGYDRVEVESDSLLVIHALRRGKGGSSDFDLIIDDIQDLISSFDKVIFVCQTFWEFSSSYVSSSPTLRDW